MTNKKEVKKQYPEYIFTMDGKEFLDEDKAFMALNEYINDKRESGLHVGFKTTEYNIYENPLFENFVYIRAFPDNSHAIYCSDSKIVLVNKKMLDEGEADIIGLTDLSEEDFDIAKRLIEEGA